MNAVPVLTVLLLVTPIFPATSSGTMAVDSAGNVWRTGKGVFVLATANAFQKSALGGVCATYQLSPFDPPTTVSCNHAYVIKQDPSGKVLYATYLAGGSEDGGTAITTDAQGNAYVTGYTYSADFPVTAGAVQPKNAGPLRPAVVSEEPGPFGPVAVAPGGDVFVSKFASDGTLVYSTLLGGSGSDVPALIGADASGSVFVAGTTSSTDFPVTAGALNHQTSASFFARLSATGAALTYATYSDPTVQAFDMDSRGDVYLTGFSQPSTPGANGGPYVTAIDTSAGTVLFSTFLPNINAKIYGSGAAIAVNASGNLFLGVSPAPLFVDAPVATPPVHPLGTAYLLQLSADGSRILTETDIGQTQFDSLVVDSSGIAYAFGHGTGTLPITPAPLLAQACLPSGGSFVIESNPAGSVVAATYFRQGDDSAVAIASPGHLLLYRSASGATLPLDLAVPPTMNFGCLENLASGTVGAGVAPGEIFVVFGYGIGPTQGVGAAPDASGQYPTSLGGVQVLINGKPAPLLFVQAGEIHAVAPFALPVTSVVEVQYQDQSAPLLDAYWSEVNPGIFVLGGQGAIVNQDGTVNTPGNPAKLGSIVSIYATGTGYLESPIRDGQLTPIPPPYTVLQFTPQVTFAGVAGTVQWAGSAPGLIAGVTQINVQMPATLQLGTTLSAVVMNSSGVFSAPATISVRQ